MRITPEDIRLIKSMGFEVVKLIVNPEPLLSDKGLSDATRWYLKEIVQLVVDEGLPVVVCIHPEWKFKEKVLSDAHEFSRLVGFLEETGRFLAASWGPQQLALQLKTEPGGNARDWNELQPRMWQAARLCICRDGDRCRRRSRHCQPQRQGFPGTHADCQRGA